MIRRTDSIGDVIHFFKIKDLHYFKELLRDYDLSIVREFLQHNIQMVQLNPFVQYFAKSSYYFIPSQNGAILRGTAKEPVFAKEGQAMTFDNEMIQAQEVLILYRISLKAELTLKELYYLEIPLVTGIKCSQKLSFYGRCTIVDLNYGTFVYRKGEPVQSIYYILAGQVKIYKKRKQQFIELNTIETGKMFGQYCFKHSKQVRQLSARSSQNGTKILVIHRQTLDQLCKEKESSIEKLFENVKSELFSFVRGRKLIRQREMDAKQRMEREKTFEQRIKGFQKQQHVNNSVLNNLAQNRTLLVKIRELNQSVRKRTLKEKTQAILNRNDLSQRRFNTNYLQHHTSRNTQNVYTLRQATKTRTADETLRSLAGLARYPSVQKYIRFSQEEDHQQKQQKQRELLIQMF